MGFLNAVVTTIAPIFIVTSPITSYADQIYSIHRTRSSAGFSLDIPLIMLVASILKVYYWFGAHFSTSLLLQSILMITVQLLLLHVALTNRPAITHHTPFQPAPTPRPYDFWQWRMARPYWAFLSYFTGTLLILHMLLASTSLFQPYTALLGYVALAIEATLPLPQMVANQRRRGCKGFRVSVIANWLIGDVFKMWFFFASGDKEVPIAFKLCGVFQMACDMGLGVQWWVFGDGVEGAPGPVMGEKGVPLEVPMGGWERARLT
ncbi:PQ loop repeat protein [Cenococcum geophilum 1.58]|uniref:PQ loop repeat protein n=1 Tax=Cenococcum geophilum 1.58 TaxID=794803 RepID=UPI00358E92EE|nr:PQ loop repeat protein [Cenococcum geophilum 1.58]